MSNEEDVSIELNFDGDAPPRCRHCGREKGRHKAITLNCPLGRGNFPSFQSDVVYEPRKPRTKKPAAA